VQKRSTTPRAAGEESCDVVAELTKNKHQRQRVLSAGKCHQHAIFRRHQPVRFNAFLNLAGEKFKKTVRAEGAVVTGQGDDGSGFAAAAFHTGCSREGFAPVRER